MSTIKKFLNLIFIDGLSGMALGLFSTLIIGTILKQAADLIGGRFRLLSGCFCRYGPASHRRRHRYRCRLQV